MVRRSWLELAAIAGAIGLASIASASETINYSYDAKGRLVQVERTKGTAPPVTTQYKHDKADNRTNVTVTGSTNPPPP